MDECMRMEFRILNRMLAGHDFYEGIRAAIIDKGVDAALAAGKRWKTSTPPTIDALFRAARRRDSSCERRRVDSGSCSSRSPRRSSSPGSSGVIAGYCLLFGILYWIRLIGFYDGPLWRFDLMPVHWQVAAVMLAVFFPFAGDRPVDAGVLGAGDLVHLRGDRDRDVSRSFPISSATGC